MTLERSDEDDDNKDTEVEFLDSTQKLKSTEKSEDMLAQTILQPLMQIALFKDTADAEIFEKSSKHKN